MLAVDESVRIGNKEHCRHETLPYFVDWTDVDRIKACFLQYSIAYNAEEVIEHEIWSGYEVVD